MEKSEFEVIPPEVKKENLTLLNEDLKTTIAELKVWSDKDDKVTVLIARQVRYALFHIQQIVTMTEKELKNGCRS